MAKAYNERVSVDMPSVEHRRIKVFAALHGQSMREFILESVRDRMRLEKETQDLAALAQSLEQDPVLTELWENDRDAGYDAL